MHSCKQERVRLESTPLMTSRSIHILLCLVSTVAKATTIACDAILIALTWIKTFGIHRAAAKAGTCAPLATILLRDGKYFSLAIVRLYIVA